MRVRLAVDNCLGHASPPLVERPPIAIERGQDHLQANGLPPHECSRELNGIVTPQVVLPRDRFRTLNQDFGDCHSHRV